MTNIITKEKQMEIFLLAVLVVGVAAYYGLMKPLEVAADSIGIAADMGKRKIERLEAEQLQDDMEFYLDLAIDVDKYVEAEEKKALLMAFKEKKVARKATKKETK